MKEKISISKVKGNPNNPRIIKNDKFKKLVKSIKEFPEMLELRPIVVDENMMVLGGNMRLKASKAAGLKEVWIDIATGLSEEQKKEFIVKDNVSFGEWEWDMIANEWNSVEITDWGLEVWQNEDDIQEELNEDLYTKTIKAPIYEPKNEKPNIDDLYNTKKTDVLISRIKSDMTRGLITEEEQRFLIAAAHRHTVFNYGKIADYYSHSNEQVQQEMEKSALIIIDLDKAIENNFVELTEYLKEIQKDEE